MRCNRPQRVGVHGWRCTLEPHLFGPCAAVPTWWNLPARWKFRLHGNGAGIFWLVYTALAITAVAVSRRLAR